ncbi:MAG: hypothetical protein DRQ78_01330 [Epsilonproteobacteria bacterium]|nr:MAG: hypothetical protein DRQ78_01330 [Campylobacterota bacterium]
MRQQMDTGKCTKTALSTLYNSLSSTVADAISIYEGETNKVAIIKIRNIDVENQVLFSTVNEFHSNVFTTQ